MTSIPRSQPSLPSLRHTSRLNLPISIAFPPGASYHSSLEPQPRFTHDLIHSFLVIAETHDAWRGPHLQRVEGLLRTCFFSEAAVVLGGTRRNNAMVGSGPAYVISIQGCGCWYPSCCCLDGTSYRHHAAACKAILMFPLSLGL